MIMAQTTVSQGNSAALTAAKTTPAVTASAGITSGSWPNIKTPSNKPVRSTAPRHSGNILAGTPPGDTQTKVTTSTPATSPLAMRPVKWFSQKVATPLATSDATKTEHETEHESSLDTADSSDLTDDSELERQIFATIKESSTDDQSDASSFRPSSRASEASRAKGDPFAG